jgi:hypothetical protein
LDLLATPAASLPDTGQAQCDDGSNNLVACNRANAGDAATYPRQDGRFGRDAAAATGALIKTGGGAAGFDYTKVANNQTDLGPGSVLGTNATNWACTRDNTTGLTWEVKTATNSDLRYSGHTYTWYNSDSSTNGGNAGNTGSNTCNGTLAAYSNQCNTQYYVFAINALNGVGLCAYTDWRMPTARELSTLTHDGTQNPSIDTTYFPNTPASVFWSGSSYVQNPAGAWFVYFSDGSTYVGDTKNVWNVRLVRGGPF